MPDPSAPARASWKGRLLRQLDPWPALKMAWRIARARPRPATPYWSVETTEACNARCVFCTYPLKAVDGRPLEETPFREFLGWARSRGVRALQFTPLTGEAFADPSLLDRLHTASEQGFDLFLFTNGSLLHRFDLDALCDCRLLALHVSFGGFDREAYRASFGADLHAQVLDNLVALLETIERRAAAGARVPQVQIDLRSLRPLSVEQASPDYARVARHVAEGRLTVVFQEWYDSFAGHLRELPGAMRLSEMPELAWLKRHRPCVYLDTMALGSRGEVRLCNCVMSAGADGLNELVTGRVEDGLEANLRGAARVRERWRAGDLPRSCRRCQNYEPVRE